MNGLLLRSSLPGSDGDCRSCSGGVVPATEQGFDRLRDRFERRVVREPGPDDHGLACGVFERVPDRFGLRGLSRTVESRERHQSPAPLRSRTTLHARTREDNEPLFALRKSGSTRPSLGRHPGSVQALERDDGSIRAPSGCRSSACAQPSGSSSRASRCGPASWGRALRRRTLAPDAPVSAAHAWEKGGRGVDTRGRQALPSRDRPRPPSRASSRLRAPGRPHPCR